MSERTHLTTYDFQGLTRMATDVTIGITNIVQDVHRQILHPPFLPSSPIQNLISNIANISFQSIKLSTKLIGRGLDFGLGKLDFKLNSVSSFEKEIAHGVLNGFVGDYLENSNNPLSIPMQFKQNGKSIKPDRLSISEALSKINGKILLMVHGLCMNDLLWQHNGHNHGEALAKELDFTTVYLHYNSGRHISTNGQSLNLLLEQLINNWPVPVEELVIVAHSMGGLVSRSALYYGNKGKQTWTKQLKKLFFLGTPHHGAPLERAGNYLDNILGATAYTKPFSRLGKMRSSGITDLRYSNLVDEDWKKVDRFKRQPDIRKNVPLPESINYYTIAATLGKESRDISDRLLGDGIVYLDSALGEHKIPEKKLAFNLSYTRIVYECNHMELLSKPPIYQQIKTWLEE